MRFALPFVLALVLPLTVPVMAQAELRSPTGPVLLTLGGNLAEGNTAARGADDGGFFGFLEISFDTGVALDADMLAAMGQAESAAGILDTLSPTQSNPLT